MANIVDTVITIVVGVIDAVAKVPGAIIEGYGSCDFIVRYLRPVLHRAGSRQTGKTTLIKC
jgi:hypothetical protein